MDKVTDTVAFVQHWLMNTDHEPSQFDRDFAAAIDARVITTTAKQLAETFCATPLPDDVCADRCATVQGSGRTGTNLLTVAQAEQVFAVALATPAPDSENLREAAERYRQALEDVRNPLAYLQRMAEAEGSRLSGMAYAIANDPATLQRIATAALGASL